MLFSYMVEPVLFVSFMTMYIEVSVVQQLFSRKVCLKHGFNETLCDGKNRLDPDISSEAASWISAYNTTLSLLTLIVGLWFGSWADKYGRKKMMMVPLIGSILSTVNFIFSSYYIRVSPIALMVSAGLIGLTTSILGITSTCYGLVSDVSSLDRRSSRMGILEASCFTGGALGFYTAGFILPRFGFVIMFSIELILHLSTIVYIMFVLEEPERPYQLSTSSVFSFRHVLSMGRTVFRAREKNYRLVVLLLLLASLMLAYGLAATSYLTYMFLTSKPIAWDGSQYSFYHGVLLAVQGMTLIVGLPICLRLLKFRDTTTAFLGSLSRFLGLAWLSYCHKSWMVYLAVVFLSFSEFAAPSLRSLLSKIVGPNEKGQAFAFVSALQSFAFLTGSQLFLGLYPTTSKMLFNGFGFALGASFQLVPLMIFTYLHFTLDLESRPLSLCTDDTNRYDSTEDSINSINVS